MKKDNRKNLFVMLMIGFFVLLVGAMGFIRSPEITDVAMLLSGFVLSGVSAYKLFVK